MREAASGEEAEDIVRREDGAIDLVLSDVVLTGISGPQLVARLRESYPSLRVIFMSGYVDETAERDGTRPGDVPFMQKPFTPAALARKVREVIDAPPGIDPARDAAWQLLPTTLLPPRRPLHVPPELVPHR